MSNDLVARGPRALGPGSPRKDRPAEPVDLAKGTKWIAEARAAIEAPSKHVLVAAPPREARAERVKLLMTCSARGISYLALAERRGNHLRLVGHEMRQPGKDGVFQVPGHLSGEYHIEINGWRCPLCRNGDSVWLCECDRMNGALHCHGNSGGRYHCACGRVEHREFFDVEKMEVRGTSVAVQTERSRSDPQRGHQPQRKQVGYERS